MNTSPEIENKNSISMLIRKILNVKENLKLKLIYFLHLFWQFIRSSCGYKIRFFTNVSQQIKVPLSVYL